MPYRRMRRKTFRKAPRNSVRRVVRAELARRIEKKQLLNSLVPTSIGSVLGTLLRPTDCNQGTGDGQRVGNRVRLDSMFINYIIDIANTSVSGYDYARFLVLMAPRGNSYSTSDMPSYAAPVDTDKFVVLLDRYVNVSSATITSTSTFAGTSTPAIIRKKFSFKSRVVEYNDNSTRPERNEVFIYAFTKNGLAQLSGFFQLKYSDA